MKRTKFLETLTKEQHQKLQRQNDFFYLISVYREVEYWIATQRSKTLTTSIIAKRTGIDEKRIQRAFRRLDYLLYILPKMKKEKTS